MCFHTCMCLHICIPYLVDSIVYVANVNDVLRMLMYGVTFTPTQNMQIFNKTFFLFSHSVPMLTLFSILEILFINISTQY